MARVSGAYYVKGKVDEIQFYEMDGERLARLASDLNRDRVKTDPAFARTMASAGRIGTASPIASDVYWQLPAYMRIDTCFDAMVGLVTKLIRDGYTVKQASSLLYELRGQNCMRHYGRLIWGGTAASIGASVYSQLPTVMQVAGYEQALVEMAKQLLEEGFTVEEAYDVLWKIAMPEEGLCKEAKEKDVICERNCYECTNKKTFADKILKEVFEISLAESAEKEVMWCDMPD